MNTTKRYEPTLTFNTRKTSFTNLLQRAVKKVDAKKALKPLIETQDYKAIAETILNAYKSNKKAKNLVPFLELIKSLQHSELIQDINCMAICEIKEKIINDNIMHIVILN